MGYGLGIVRHGEPIVGLGSGDDYLDHFIIRAAIVGCTY